MADPRDYVTPTRVGTPLRDAAVDPRPGDFLAPSNAGAAGVLGNPHGPHVVSPGLHGDESVRTIRPGAVGTAPDPQEADEMSSLIAAQPTAATPEPPAPTE